MSESAYFEYALVLPEERYLIEVQTRNPATGELRGQQEMESIAKECLASVIGEGHEDVVKELRPYSIVSVRRTHVASRAGAYLMYCRDDGERRG